METPSALARVDFCITTFKRPEAVERLVLSIGRHYPEAAVHIGDQNETLDRRFYDELAPASGLIQPPTVHPLEFDCGISAARNHLVTSTPREYKLILDDDFLFTERTTVDRFVRLLDALPAAGLVAGAVARGSKVSNPRYGLQREGSTLLVVPDEAPFREHDGVRYAPADFVANFALHRRELFTHVQWDPELKVFEHRDFFLRLKESPYEALFTPDVVIDHHRATFETDYRAFRRRFEYMRQMLQKHGFTWTEDADEPHDPEKSP